MAATTLHKGDVRSQGLDMARRHTQLLVTMPQSPVLTPAPSVELTATCDHSRVGLPSTHGAKVAPSKRNNQRRRVAITAVAQAKL